MNFWEFYQKLNEDESFDMVKQVEQTGNSVGWITPQGGIKIVPVHQHLQFIQDILPPQYNDLKNAYTDAEEVEKSFYKDLEDYGDEHPEMHNLDKMLGEMEKEKTLILYLGYKLGYSRIGATKQRVEVEAFPESMTIATKVAKDIANMLDISVSGIKIVNVEDKFYSNANLISSVDPSFKQKMFGSQGKAAAEMYQAIKNKLFYNYLSWDKKYILGPLVWAEISNEHIHEIAFLINPAVVIKGVELNSPFLPNKVQSTPELEDKVYALSGDVSPNGQIKINSKYDYRIHDFMELKYMDEVLRGGDSKLKGVLEPPYKLPYIKDPNLSRQLVQQALTMLKGH